MFDFRNNLTHFLTYHAAQMTKGDTFTEVEDLRRLGTTAATKKESMPGDTGCPGHTLNYVVK